MEHKSLKTLEFDKILERLAALAKNDAAKELALKLVPTNNIRAVEQTLDETDAAVQLLLKFGSPEIVRISDISESVKRLNAGGGLSMSELLNISRTDRRPVGIYHRA